MLNPCSIIQSNVVFLSSQNSLNLPPAVNFDPYTPRINLDSKKVIATQAFAAALKEHLTEILKQPVEARLSIIKPVEYAGTFMSCIFHSWLKL